MRLGISPFASTREGALALAGAAVEGGLDTLWLGDGYLSNPDFGGWAGGMESMAELAWLGGRFPSARLGLTAAILTIRDPFWTAKQANTIDRIAGGGFVLVVSPGFWRHDVEAGGVRFEDRGRVFGERLAQLMDAIGDDRYSPGPGEGGPPPIWLAGARHTMNRAIELGLTFHSSRTVPADLEPLAREFFDRGGTALAHRVRVEHGEHQVEGEVLDWKAVTGSVDQLVDSLGRYRDMGVSELAIIPGQDDETSLKTVEILVTEVAPQLRDSSSD